MTNDGVLCTQWVLQGEPESASFWHAWASRAGEASFGLLGCLFSSHLSQPAQILWGSAHCSVLMDRPYQPRLALFFLLRRLMTPAELIGELFHRETASPFLPHGPCTWSSLHISALWSSRGKSHMSLGENLQLECASFLTL